MKTNLIRALFLIIVASVGATAPAALVTLEIQGTVQTVSGALSGTFTAGDGFTTLIGYENTTADTFTSGSISGNPASNIGLYNGSITSCSFSVKNAGNSIMYAASATPSPISQHISIFNDHPNGLVTDDSIRVGLSQTNGEWATAPSVSSMPLSRFSLGLNSAPFTQAFANDLLTTMNWTLSDYPAERYFFFGFGDPEQTVLGQINSITILPEPAALGLLGIGAIGFLRRRKM